MASDILSWQACSRTATGRTSLLLYTMGFRSRKQRCIRHRHRHRRSSGHQFQCFPLRTKQPISKSSDNLVTDNFFSESFAKVPRCSVDLFQYSNQSSAEENHGDGDIGPQRSEPPQKAVGIASASEGTQSQSQKTLIHPTMLSDPPAS